MDGLLSQSRVLNSSIFGAGSSVIKSVQRGQGTFTGATNNITITEIDLEKTICRITYHLDQVAAMTTLVSVALTSTTNLRLERTNGDSGTLTCSWEVIEFYNVKSLQTGTATLTGTDTNINVTITSVNLEKTFVFVSMRSSSNETNLNSAEYIAMLTSATNLYIDARTAQNSRYFEWQVIEFY